MADEDRTNFDPSNSEESSKAVIRVTLGKAGPVMTAKEYLAINMPLKLGFGTLPGFGGYNAHFINIISPFSYAPAGRGGEGWRLLAIPNIVKRPSNEYVFTLNAKKHQDTIPIVKNLSPGAYVQEHESAWEIFSQEQAGMNIWYDMTMLYTADGRSTLYINGNELLSMQDREPGHINIEAANCGMYARDINKESIIWNGRIRIAVA